MNVFLAVAVVGAPAYKLRLAGDCRLLPYLAGGGQLGGSRGQGLIYRLFSSRQESRLLGDRRLVFASNFG